ncbi:uncharacterized protein BDR25DRAFT_358460 [Lindgomyces ingoldianus]|uniref:Uncharacterized protein n=1 Tax=Lindgomyces ingoldianus TaxID=673940 RepID=A0ACB6QMF1_9PLEO|nr:uncharacterized protein BDR25DRAFT_358460 [Lindgomyces ingoldianus]KAF2467753.1 hypothetical protein BDR25DRAFT_358460 [Lindgomyces ingoldianus]
MCQYHTSIAKRAIRLQAPKAHIEQVVSDHLNAAFFLLPARESVLGSRYFQILEKEGIIKIDFMRQGRVNRVASLVQSTNDIAAWMREATISTIHYIDVAKLPSRLFPLFIALILEHYLTPLRKRLTLSTPLFVPFTAIGCDAVTRFSRLVHRLT